ncbi:hypothetical protein SISSUDRAFT_1121518 [Sistotremastrum suecicum HHB10207 ss-3]|uniref:Zn(2)-C6 fungal-type domain-containing protein n=1 Tax=Sistotremastrum suecicum HHB10207 ss-3 TaxID=1314776 RepID=A0A166AQC7_9AGAM|nr:hypothetical protein SISSUDRAFT_1121518 [Sistotremastrum suecicum HHB10207 ss-3]
MSFFNPSNEDTAQQHAAGTSTSSSQSPTEETANTSGRTPGCWTCRLRRKKCDLERVNGSCKTCSRLQIDCLGWGEKRPDWMRDTTQVAIRKAQLRSQMHRSRQPPAAQATTPPPVLSSGAAPNLPGGGFYDLAPGEGEVGSTSMAASSSTVGENSYEGLILFYFQNVVSYEFRFASEHVLQTLQHAVIRNSHGPVPNAIVPPNSLPFTIFQKAVTQLKHSKDTQGWYFNTDAMAAIELVKFAQMRGSIDDWRLPLDVCCHWLHNSPLNKQANPMSVLPHMSDVARFSTEATIWMETFACITTGRRPLFLTLCRNMWGNAEPTPGGPAVELSMSGLMGCSNQVMLAFAEIAGLAAWKEEKRRAGSLSVRRLVEAGRVIETALRATRTHASLSDDVAKNANIAAQLSNTQSTLAQTSRGGLDANQSLVPFIEGVFFNTALLYLQTILNDNSPGVPYVQSAVRSLVQILNWIPTPADASLLLPICLAGCMTDDATERNLFSRRLQNQNQHIGNVAHVRLVMESVWQRRDTLRVNVDWRDVMQELGFKLLLA